MHRKSAGGTVPVPPFVWTWETSLSSTNEAEKADDPKDCGTKAIPSMEQERKKGEKKRKKERKRRKKRKKESCFKRACREIARLGPVYQNW